MEDKFEATFVVDAPPDLVWQRLSTAQPLQEGPSPASPQRWMASFEGLATDLAVEPGRRLRVVKDTMPCKGTEIVVILEAAGSGTKVTVVQSGFGAMFESALEGLTIGWENIVADLGLYLELGVRGGRHLRPWGNLGCSVRQRPSGVEVTGVTPGFFAERAGLQTGDILVTLGGAPLAQLRDFFTLQRAFRSGQEVNVTWARGPQLLRAKALV